MTNAVTRFEIYAEAPEKLAEFYRAIAWVENRKDTRNRLLASTPPQEKKPGHRRVLMFGRAGVSPRVRHPAIQILSEIDLDRGVNTSRTFEVRK